MAKYLGQTPVDISTHPEFSTYTPADWSMYFIESYGQIDGSHHKTWVLDQVARIYHGTNVIVEEASWDNGEKEYRIWLDEPSQAYLDWVAKMKGPYINTPDYEGYEYDYDEGIAP